LSNNNKDKKMKAEKEDEEEEGSKAGCRSGEGCLMQGVLETIYSCLEEPSVTHMEHVALTSHSIQPASLSTLPVCKRFKATN
jgi:hypothetical protein